MSQVEILEIMWVNAKVPEKRREMAFMVELKTFQPKNNSSLSNSTPALSRKSSLNNTTQKIVYSL